MTTSTLAPAAAHIDRLTTGTQARALTGVELRDSSEDRDGHSFTGIAVPWDTQIDLWGIREEFAPGSIVPNPAGVIVCWRHDEPIGRVADHREQSTGWEIDATISRTVRGDEAATLLTDGVINRLSVRFRPETFEVDESGEVPVIRHTRAVVDEVSLVPFPAYETAEITEIRQEPTMPPETHTAVAREDLDEVREEVTTLARQVALLDSAPSAPAAPQFRSFGEYVKQLAAGDEDAMRAYTGATSGDSIVKDAWVGDVIRLGTARQRITNLFTHTKDLPAEGMNVEYGYLESDTTKVAEQAAEGDDLLYGKIKLGVSTGKVRTLGGWSELTRQEIERSSVNVLDFTFRAMFLRYARAIETMNRATLTAAYNDATATALSEVEADLTTQDGIVEGLIDLVEHFEDTDVNLSGLVFAKDAFLALLAVPATDRVLQVTQAPEDKLGTVTVNSVEGNISGLKVSLWPGGPAGGKLAYDETAIRSQEAPGAPFRLQDENIVNLSKAFSVYGYGASYVQVRPGLVKIAAPVAG